MYIKRVSAICLLVVLSGCGLYGPSYNKPDTNNPTDWNSKDSLAKISTSADLPDTAWWKSFNDPVLNDLIADALKNNPNIQTAIGNIIQAQGNLEAIEMAWVPLASLRAGYGNGGPYSNGSNGAVSNSIVGANSGFSALGMVPSYSMNILQQIRTQQSYRATLYAQQYAKDAMRLTVISQVAGGYFSLRGLDYQLVLQKELVTDTGKQLELGQAQYKLGYISLLTLQNYEQQYETAKAQIPVLQSNIVQAENALQVLLNRNPGPIVRGLNFEDIKMDGIIPANMPSTVLLNRPDVQQAEQQLIAANANIGVATSTFFPSIGLTGSTGSASNYINGLFTPVSNFWSTQVTATMPILNLAAFGQIKSAKGAYYAAYYTYIQTVRNAFAQVDNGFIAHDSITKSYGYQKLQYDSTKVAYDLGNQRYTQGLDSLMTMLNYKITMDNAGITLANLKVQQLQIIVNLYQALAGGVNVNNNAEPNKFGDGHDA